VWGSEPDSDGFGRCDLFITQLVRAVLGSQIRHPEPDTPFQPDVVSLGIRMAVVSGVRSKPGDAAVEVNSSPSHLWMILNQSRSSQGRVVVDSAAAVGRSR